MKRILPLLSLAWLLSGCMHTVNYKLAEDDHWTGSTIPGVLCVEPIADNTVYGIADWKPLHKEDKDWRLNSRGDYSHTNLTGEVTAMMVKHLVYSGLFTRVITGPPANADFVLSGRLTEFKTQAEINSAAEGIQAGTAAFGALGALVSSAATSGMTSEIRTAVKIEDLKITDSSGQIRWQDSISVNIRTNMYFLNADKTVLYRFPDLALKDAVREMIQRLGNSSLATNRSLSSR
jgi:hypothetical protein